MSRPHLLLAACIALAVVAACGGGAGVEPPSQTPASPSAAPTSSAVGPSGSASPAGSASAAATSVGPGVAAPPGPVEMKPPAATAMVADLQGLGLDAKTLAPIEKLDPKALRAVMKLFARSLGVKCGDCHTEGDFAAPTRRKKIAAKMWNEFVGKLTLADGSPLFCDSCHQGRIKLLDRSDKKALGKWMQASFADGLKRKDGKTEECESCHVDWDMTFLSSWGR
jgi:hypothetical protein